MADDVPTSRKVPPLAIIVVVILAALAAVAFSNIRSQQHSPRGGPSMPQSQEVARPSVMPQQSTVPNHQVAASDEKGAMGHDDSSDEPGGPAKTANLTATAH